MLFFRVFEHLLPHARAWTLTIEKQLRQFFDGITGPLGTDIKKYADDVFDDIFPATTRQLDEWERQFGLPSNLPLEQDRRDRLDGAWKAQGGQSPRYIQDTLRNAGFDVYVHEWWKLPAVASPGPQIPRNAYLLLSETLTFEAQDNGKDQQDGDAAAQDGGEISPSGYALTNNSEIQTVPNDSTKFPYFLYIAGENFVDGLPFATVDKANIPTSRRAEF